MIRHIVMFRLKQDTGETVLRQLREKAFALLELDEIYNGDIVVNAAEAPDYNYDLAMILDFRSMRDLNTYQNNPDHLEFKEMIEAYKEDRACIDYAFDEEEHACTCSEVE